MANPTFLPSWDEYQIKTKDYREKLEPFYRDYITTISTDIMAISLELATFLVWFSTLTMPKTILDLCSGFSSFALRYFWRDRTEIWSIDDHRDRLAARQTVPLSKPTGSDVVAE